jgi:hypothetical protein
LRQIAVAIESPRQAVDFSLLAPEHLCLFVSQLTLHHAFVDALLLTLHSHKQLVMYERPFLARVFAQWPLLALVCKGRHSGKQTECSGDQ